MECIIAFPTSFEASQIIQQWYNTHCFVFFVSNELLKNHVSFEPERFLLRALFFFFLFPVNGRALEN